MNHESLLKNAGKEVPDIEAQAVEDDFGARKKQPGDKSQRSDPHAADYLKSVRSAREQLDLEPTRQNSHACRVELVAKLMETNMNTGLTAQVAAERLQTYGLNKLAEAKPDTLLLRLWRQINQILIWILLVAAVVSAAVQQWPEFGLILAVVVINVILGVAQEGKASKATAALKSMLSSKATVIRDGNRVEIDAQEVVPGDIIFVESGNKVPADIRLFQVSNLAVQEAMLTGESLPVNKTVKSLDLALGLGDRKNMCYSATLVIKGQGTGICVATGDTTEIGRIAELVSEVKETKTNLLLQIDAFGKWIGLVVLPIALATFLIALLTPINLSTSGASENGTTNVSSNKAQESFIIAVAIAVSMIPAGLPAIITICLAIATTYMAKKNAIVKTLPSVETLGSVMVICSDKTGTLTKNEMTVVATRTTDHLYAVSGVGYDPANGQVTSNDGTDPVSDKAFVDLIRGGILNNESRIERTADERGRNFVAPVGDPSECALCCLAEKSKLDFVKFKADFARVGVIPFESEHKFMVTFHKQPVDERGTYLAVIKGAPDRLASRSNKMLKEDGTEVDFDSQFWTEQVAQLSSNGYRCLAVCQTTISAPMLVDITGQGAAWLTKAEKPFLTFVGLVAILDPPREECITAIKEAHRAGILVKMITGDHPATAKAIGKQLGIVDGEHQQVLTGPEMDKMELGELDKHVVHCNIFARASPDNKISIVRSLQNCEKVCSMTGDGVNDAPALRAADIGVAMGITGSDVSKDAAKIILTDDNFATILVAVKEGRRVWDNLRKILLFNMPANFGQGGVIFIAVCLQWDVIPLTAIQVLYVNMITACTLGLILAIEPAESTVMDRPPRRLNKGLIGSFFYWRNIFVTFIFICFVLGSVSWIKALDPIKYGPSSQRSIAFNTLIFCEIGYAFNCRFLKLSSIHPRIFHGNPGAWVCAFLMAGLNVLVTYVPGLNTFFSMTGMDGTQWGIVIFFAVVSFLLVELEKVLSDPLRPFTQPIVRGMKGFFGMMPSCSRLVRTMQCCTVKQTAKPLNPIDPATRQGGSMRAVPEELLQSSENKESGAVTAPGDTK